MIRIIPIILCFLLGACSFVPSKVTSSTEAPSAIALCGGGIDSGVKAGIEAEYSKLSGSVDASFSEYVRAVLDTNNVSEEKFNSYLNCILIIDERQRADKNKKEELSFCLSSCNSYESSCSTQTNKMFKSCISSQMSGCYRDCKRRGFSHDECTANKCSWSNLKESSREFYSDRCKQKNLYIEQEASCNIEFASCKKRCENF